MPRPMPRPEPVTTATLPSSNFPMRVLRSEGARLTCAARECQSNARSSGAWIERSHRRRGRLRCSRVKYNDGREKLLNLNEEATQPVRKGEAPPVERQRADRLDAGRPLQGGP